MITNFFYISDLRFHCILVSGFAQSLAKCAVSCRAVYGALGMKDSLATNASGDSSSSVSVVNSIITNKLQPNH